MTDLDRKDKLELILLSYASNIEQRNVIHNNFRNANIKDYVYALCDGLRYGNWPWIQHNQSKNNEIHYIGCPAYNNIFGSCNCVKMGRE